MKLLLNGGGVGNQVENARYLLNNIINHNKKILYIPFAWPDSTYNGCLDFIEKELSDVESLGIDMVKTPEELLNKNFTDYACLYIGGGNTYKLLNDLKMSGNFEKIKRYLLKEDGIVYGGSAGAIIFGKDLDSCNTDDKNNVGLKDNRGFDMINSYSLLCHYTSRNEQRTELSKNYLLELSKTKPIYAIPEEDTIFIDEEKIKIFGTRPYYIFKNGKVEEKVIDKSIKLK
jgi:dipeptidase E